MAHLLVFPDEASAESGLAVLEHLGTSCELLRTPQFCEGLVANAVIVAGNLPSALEELFAKNVPVSGATAWQPFGREIPDAESPDPRWRELLGSLRLTSFRPSVTDPLKLHVALEPGNSIGSLIPLMARLIRGGSFRQDVPVLALEEEHRVIAFSARQLVISRADDLLDVWIMVRTCVDLICAVWVHRDTLAPESDPRMGIGPIELFKRLPSTNCRACGYETCMEFATQLFMRRVGPDVCGPLSEKPSAGLRKSLQWIMRAMGLAEIPDGFVESRAGSTSSIASD